MSPLKTKLYTVPFVCLLSEGPEYEFVKVYVALMQEWGWRYLDFRTEQEGLLLCFFINKVEYPSFKRFVVPCDLEKVYRALYDRWEKLR